MRFVNRPTALQLQWLVMTACVLTDAVGQEPIRPARRCNVKPHLKVQSQHFAASKRLFAGAGVAHEILAQRIQIPVVFHVFHDGPDGKLKKADLDAQLEVLNRAFRPHEVSFSEHASPQYWDRPSWFRMATEASAKTTSMLERDAKRRAAKDPQRILHIYTTFTNDYASAPFGWAYQPYDKGLQTEPFLDGVVVLYTTLPGQVGPDQIKYKGMTAVHEIGHWLGLLHTYHCDCHDTATDPCCCGSAELGDQVADTPAHLDLSATVGGTPTRGLDSCPNSPDPDPIRNYMSYSDDDFVKEFTPGQVERMKNMAAIYRPQLSSTNIRLKTDQALRGTR